LSTPQEDHKRIADGVAQMASELLSLSIDTILRSDLGVELSFSAARFQLESVLRLIAQLARVELESLPPRLLQTANTALAQLRSRLQQFAEFSIVQNANALLSERNGRLNAFIQQADVFTEQIAPVLSYAASQRMDEEYAGVTAELASKSLELTQYALSAQQTDNKLKELLQIGQQAVQQLGVSRHAVYFSAEAELHDKASKRWLLFTSILGLFTAAFAYQTYVKASSFLHDTTVVLDGPRALQLALAKFIGFSILFSVTLWCGRVYKAHRHNYIINRHRQNALSSFEAFAESSTDPQTKNAVLLQATQSIFAPQATGFGHSDGEMQNPAQMIELIRTVAPAAK
jgi:hypothetical protein